MDRQRYVRLGASLLSAGVFILAASIILLGSYPGVSTGLALIVLGLVILVLGKTAPGVSSELAELMARTGYENLGRLLEELGLQTRAVYLPSGLLSAGARALIPLTEDACCDVIAGRLGDRLVASYGHGQDDVGLLVSTPGSVALGLLPYPPGPTVDEMSVALTQVAVSSLRIAHGIQLHEHDWCVEASFTGESAPTGWLASAVEVCLGSVSASIAAAVIAESKGRRVTIESESLAGSTRKVRLALLPEQVGDVDH